MPLILSGRACRDAIIPALTDKVRQLGRAPVLAIIQVGDRPDSTSYIKSKGAFAGKIGARVKLIHLKSSCSQEEIISHVNECNTDRSVDGIIVQLPLPEGVDRDAVVGAIAVNKDADGLVPGSKITPATARGVRELLDFYEIPLSGKKVTVIGRSKLVGGPIAEMCRAAGAEVTVCHRGTSDLLKETISADVLISAAGSAGLIGKRHVQPGAVVIDVGINPISGEPLEGEGKVTTLVGDVDFEGVKNIASAISPVPGGVGPMTVCALFQNLIDLCEV